MALTDAVPSSAIDVLADNAKVFDQLINQTSGTVTNRIGDALVVYQEVVASNAAQLEIDLGNGIVSGVQAVLPLYASVAAWTGVEGQAVIVQGRTVVGDGGAGLFVAHVGTSPGANGGTIINTANGWITRQFSGDVDPRWAGAEFDGVTVDSAPFNTIVANHPNVEIGLPFGTSVLADVQLNNNLSGRGVNTVLKAAGTSEVLRLGYIDSPSQWSKRKVSNLVIDGNTKASDGVKFTDVTNPQISGRWAIENLTFLGCKRAIYKPTGNIGNAYRDANFVNGDYGVYAVGQTSPLMHAGCDVYDNCQFNGNALAAIYYDSSQNGTGGVQITGDTILQNNPGFAIFVKNWASSYTPFVMDGVWFEGNATAGTVDINGTSYSPVDVHMENTAMAVLKNGIVPKVRLVASRLHIDACHMIDGTTEIVADANSVVTADAVHTNGGIYPVQMNSIASAVRSSGNFALRALAPARTEKSHDQVGIALSIPFANANTYNFSGTSSVNASTVADGRIFDSAAELTVPASYTLQTAVATITSGKWYVFTLDVKHISGTLSDLTMDFSNTVVVVPNFRSLLVTGKWVTVSGVCKAASSGNARLRLVTGAVGSQVVRMSALQCVEFDTEQDAIDFYNARQYRMPNTLPRTIYSTVSPTTGTWAVGDRCVNVVQVVGQPKAWACTVAGTPGTWVSEGNL